MSSRQDNEYPAGDLTVRGYTTMIYTDGEGQWLARVNGVKVTGPTRDALKAALGRQLRAATMQVAVPFLTKEGPLGDGRYRVRQGTATGIHSGSSNILVTWAGDGEKGQVTSYGSDKYMDGGADPAEWQRLLDEANRAARALYAYEQAHKANLREAVRKALADAVAAETGSEDDPS